MCVLYTYHIIYKVICHSLFLVKFLLNLYYGFFFPVINIERDNLGLSIKDAEWLTLCLLGNFTYFFVVCCCFFQNQLFWKISSVSNSLDPDQARHFVRPDLSPNCLQRLLADVTSRQRVKKCANLLITMQSV